jgi:hypothetical protein
VGDLAFACGDLHDFHLRTLLPAHRLLAHLARCCHARNQIETGAWPRESHIIQSLGQIEIWAAD